MLRHSEVVSAFRLRHFRGETRPSVILIGSKGSGSHRPPLGQASGGGAGWSVGAAPKRAFFSITLSLSTPFFSGFLVPIFHLPLVLQFLASPPMASPRWPPNLSLLTSGVLGVGRCPPPISINSQIFSGHIFFALFCMEIAAPRVKLDAAAHCGLAAEADDQYWFNFLHALFSQWSTWAADVVGYHIHADGVHN